MKHVEGLGYPHPFLMMQITAIKNHDNNGPQRALPDFIRDYNIRAEAEDGVRLRFATLSEVFDRFRNLPADGLPNLRGDWTVWWNFGAGSTARGTAMGMRGQRKLKVARALSVVAPKSKAATRTDAFETAQDKLALLAEHTWGTARSINRPETSDTLAQQLIKLSNAAEGASLARMLVRDGLQDICTKGQGDVPMVLLANPHAVPVRQSVKLPALPPFAEPPAGPRQMGQDLTVPWNKGRFQIHHQDVIATNLQGENALWTQAFDLPPLSYKFVPVSEISPADTTGIASKDGEISNRMVTLKLDLQNGGVESLTRGEYEFATRNNDLLTFGVPVFEAIKGGDRDLMFGAIDNSTPDWSQAWNTDWPAERTPGKLVATTSPDVGRGQVSIRQDFELPNGDKAAVTYRLLPGDANLQLHVAIDKTADAGAHSIYLPMPANLWDEWLGEFETAGAIVELDKEQIPFSSRHYITTQTYMRLADDTHEFTVCCPDTPLWQIGGYNFARFNEPDGSVEREAPVLLAWLTNNYWSTNFQADQSGRITSDFTIHVGSRRTRASALQWAHCAALPIQNHLCDPDHSGSAGLYEFGLHPELGETVATSVERTGSNDIAFTLMNPGYDTAEVAFSSEFTHVLKRTNLAGAEVSKIDEGTKSIFTMRSGEWCRLIVQMNNNA